MNAQGVRSWMATVFVLAAAASVAAQDVRYKDCTVTVVDESTGAPIPGAVISYYRDTLHSDEQGNFVLHLKLKDYGTYLFVRAPGYTPRRVQWRTPDPSQVPDRYTVKMNKGVTIGGKIVDESGQPVAGTTVYILGTGSDMGDDLRPFEDKNFVWDEKAITDVQGAWSYPDYPADRNHVSLRVTHPRYVSDDHYRSYNNIAALKTGTFELKLAAGTSLYGTVVDPEGRPVAGALVFQGASRFGSDYPETRTGPNGDFNFPQARPGKMVLTAVKPGFAPELVVVDTSTQSLPAVNIQLKPGHRVELTVLDPAGKPVEDAWVLPDSWRQIEGKVPGQDSAYFRTLADISRATHDAGALRYNKHTDRNGRFAWTWAPEDAVQYSVIKPGWASIRDLALSPQDSGKTVTMYPELSISGRVTDKATGAKIESFTLYHAHAAEAGTPRFIKKFPFRGQQGRYTINIGEPDGFYWIKVEAKGYTPAVSRPITLKEGRVTADFALEEAELVTARVQGPDGTPLPGVTVHVLEPEDHVTVEGGLLEHAATLPGETSDASGAASFNAPADAYVLFVLSDAGVGWLTSAELEQGSALTVKPWARVEAVVTAGGAAVANQQVFLHPRDLDPAIQHNLNFFYVARTGADGKAVFPRVLPQVCQAALGMEEPEDPDGSRTITMESSQDIEPQPGKTTLVRFDL